MSVEVRGGEATRLRYTPPFFFPGVAAAALGLGAAFLFMTRPAIISGFLKTRRDEGK